MTAPSGRSLNPLANIQPSASTQWIEQLGAIMMLLEVHVLLFALRPVQMTLEALAAFSLYMFSRAVRLASQVREGDPCYTWTPASMVLNEEKMNRAA